MPLALVQIRVRVEAAKIAFDVELPAFVAGRLFGLLDPPRWKPHGALPGRPRLAGAPSWGLRHFKPHGALDGLLRHLLGWQLITPKRLVTTWPGGLFTFGTGQGACRWTIFFQRNGWPPRRRASQLPRARTTQWNLGRLEQRRMPVTRVFENDGILRGKGGKGAHVDGQISGPGATRVLGRECPAVHEFDETVGQRQGWWRRAGRHEGVERQGHGLFGADQGTN